jgi:hypothetical protein
VLGIVCLIEPIRDGAGVDFARVRAADLPITLAFSVAMLVPLGRGPGAARAKAALLLVAYAGYSAWLYATGRV